MKRPSEELCELLDDYLDGALPGEEVAAFAVHLCECAACREAVEEQQWIDGLLRSPAAVELELPLTAVAIPFVRIRRRRILAVAAAVALFAATAALLFPLPRREGLGEGRPTVADARDAASESDSATALRSVATGDRAQLLPSLSGRGISGAEFVSSGSSIAVAVPSDDPQVTIVQLYPTVTASRRWAREAELRANALPPNGG